MSVSHLNYLIKTLCTYPNKSINTYNYEIKAFADSHRISISADKHESGLSLEVRGNKTITICYNIFGSPRHEVRDITPMLHPHVWHNDHYIQFLDRYVAECFYEDF